MGPGQLAEGVLQRTGGKSGVQSGKSIPQPSLQDHLPIVVTLGVGRVRSDVRAVRHLPAQSGKPVEGGGFNVGFGDGGH